MKRIFSLLLVILFAASALAACGGGEAENSAQSAESAAKTVSADESGAPAEPSAAQSSLPEPNDSGTEVKYTVYSEKPWFAVIGTCADGATVHGRIGDGETVDSKSWHGWFSLRLQSKTTPVEVEIWQTTGEGDSRPYTYKLRPTAPTSGEGVITGYNTQFFYQKCLPDFQRTNVPDKSLLKGLGDRVRDRLEKMRAVNPGAEIIYMIVPSSVTVYPETAPVEYTRNGGKSRLDVFEEVVAEAGATVVDLRDVFAEHRDDEMPLYQHFDSHWADYGGYIAYKKLFDHISQRFPAAAPLPVDAFDWNPGYYESGDMPMYLSLPPEKIMDYGYWRKFKVEAPEQITAVTRYRRPNNLVYSDAVTEAKIFDTDRPELPSCIVYRDSFGTQIYDILAERMNVTDYIGMWGFTWDNARVEREKPDYVIYLVAEWNLNMVIYG